MRASITVLLLTLLGALDARAQSVQDAHALAAVGEYEAAVEMLQQVALPDGPDHAKIALGRLLIELGQFEDAENLLQPLAHPRRGGSPAAWLVYAELLFHTGQLEEAARLLTLAIDATPEGLPEATSLRADTRYRSGDQRRAVRSWEHLIAGYEEGRLTEADEIALVGVAYHRLERYEEANAAFAQAVAQDPASIEARLGWAALFLEKYRPDQAQEVALEVLALNPREPRATVLLARAEAELASDPSRAIELAQRALETNPALPEAYELLAEIALDDEESARAIEILGGVLRRNPARLESMTLTAAAHYLLDERRAYRRIERRVLEQAPHYAAFYGRTADFVSNAFRYDEAVRLYREALEIDSDYWPAYIGLGLGLTRQGDDETGLIYLRLALENDPFNVRAYHLVQLYEDTLLEYERFESEHFHYRLHRSERAVLEPYLTPLAEQTFRAYAERYGFEPEGRLSLELFRDPATFAIRSVGLPHVAPHGICFGRLITSRSPSTGNFNWAEVVAHELSHVFTLALSEARVPRWLTEGIADYDTSLQRSEWRREGEFALLTRLRTQGLTSVRHLNQAFVRSTDVDEVLAAYFQSSVTVEMIVDRWGQDAVVDMLRLFAERRALDEVLEEVTGLEVEAFDSAVEAYINTRLGGLVHTFEPQPIVFGDEAFYEARVAANPDDAQALAELAMAKYRARRIDECQDAIARALSLDPLNPLANFLAASFDLREQRVEEARRRYLTLLDAGVDGYTLRTELAYLERREGRVEEAIEHLQRAALIYPRGLSAARELADILMRSGEIEEAEPALRRVIELDENDDEPVDMLIRMLVAAERWDDAWPLCEMSFNIDPFDAHVHHICGRVAVERSDWANARRELEMEQYLGAADADETQRLLDRIP